VRSTIAALDEDSMYAYLDKSRADLLAIQEMKKALQKDRYDMINPQSSQGRFPGLLWCLASQFQLRHWAASISYFPFGWCRQENLQNLQDVFLKAKPPTDRLKAVTPEVSEAQDSKDPGPYRSVDAGKAATELERLGCTVYPPKPKDTLQWDRLAGETMSCEQGHRLTYNQVLPQ
jgi:hypothetical protein